MRRVHRGHRTSLLIGLLAAIAGAVWLPAHGASIDIDLDGNPANGAESRVETNLLQSFPVMIENVVFNNTIGTPFTFEWTGAGPGGFTSILAAGPDVGTKWEWTTVSQVYSISTPGSFFEESGGIQVFGVPAGGFVTPGNGGRVFTLPGKSIFPNQVTTSTESLTASLITFFSPENTIATCESTFAPGVFYQTITNNSGEPLTLTVEQPDCCLEPHQIICDDVCQSYLTDPENCGDCGTTCEDDEFCDQGACAPICPGTGQEYCDGECVDTLNDPANCGGCGITCEDDEFCDQGACAPLCPDPGQEYCDGECVDTLNDPANCGGCGITCEIDEFCDQGSCAPLCPDPGQEFCNGACVDTLNDPANCGGCGITCEVDEFCDQGACAPLCPGEGQEFCGGACVDTFNDPANCGGCGITCEGDEFCDQGACAPVCPAGLTLCGAICVDLQNDPLNCGACDNACGPNDICEAATCETCHPPLGTACDNECVNTHTDPFNCGGCGLVCDFTDCPSEGQGTCSQGSSCVCDPVDGAAAPISFAPVFTDQPENFTRVPASRPSQLPTVTPPVANSWSRPNQPGPKQVERAVTGRRSAARPQRRSSDAGPGRGEWRSAVRGNSSSAVELSRPRHPGGPEESAATGGVEEAPVCAFQDPIEQTIPDGESYTQCQTGALLGTEVFTLASIFKDGELVGVGPCAVVIPAPEIVVDDFYATMSSIILVDDSGDGLLQPGETADLYLELLNVGPLELMNPVATLNGPPDDFNPEPVTVINDTAIFPDFPQFENVADCETPPVLEPQMSLTPFTIMVPEEQDSNVARPLHLTIEGSNVGPVTFEMPIIIGIGENCDPAELNGENYDGLEGFLSPLDVPLVPRGSPVNYSDAALNGGSNVPLKLRVKCGANTLGPDEIDPNPQIVSIVHETLGAQPLESINADNNANPSDPFFECGQSRCEFGLRTVDLPLGTYVVGIRMADSRVFEAGFTLVDLVE